MPIKMKITKPAALFLFPHQDDEYGVFYEIEKSIQKNVRPICLYLTDGSYGEASPEDRNEESRKVLTRLGVQEENIHFIGTRLCIKDTKLCFFLPAAVSAIAELIENQRLSSLYCPAWEGGHPDHDALFLIASIIIEKQNIKTPCWQYPLYNAANLTHPFFRVLQPLKNNGRTVSKPIPPKNRLKYLLYCTSYKTQIRSWIGLFPLVAWHYLTDGRQYLTPVNPIKTYHRPHAGPLYYEKRGFMTWREFAYTIKNERREDISHPR